LHLIIYLLCYCFTYWLLGLYFTPWLFG